MTGAWTETERPLAVELQRWVTAWWQETLTGVNFDSSSGKYGLCFKNEVNTIDSHLNKRTRHAVFVKLPIALVWLATLYRTGYKGNALAYHLFTRAPLSLCQLVLTWPIENLNFWHVEANCNVSVMTSSGECRHAEYTLEMIIHSYQCGMTLFIQALMRIMYPFKCICSAFHSHLSQTTIYYKSQV